MDFLLEEYNNTLDFAEGILIDNNDHKITLLIGKERYPLSITKEWIEKMCYKYFGEHNYIYVSIRNSSRLILNNYKKGTTHYLDVK